ncbi:uncharacterized protein I206_107646 [Kwoniella pini CBS 10737]|uniref:Uncharacterized protein n=1 Tax=Kwoniella pini CBS 10737 TaxID=1296096 RepID=A0A1B9HXV2_9TREE|nr:uncharacterized protein I206_05981 [Kwoniella pini CBS 10737]OCF48113.1 hypothetical protein I206_05981 [Kwoniella pini CBS 10737]
MSSIESTHSLLIPPNPSLSPNKPSASILLNGTGRPATKVTIPSPPRTTTPLPETSSFTSFPLSSSSSGANTPPSSFASTSSLSRSTSSPHPANLSRRLSTPKISFAPLPAIPNELKRRNSISIGVASRKNLIGGGGGGYQNVNRLMMSDEDWENYKKHYSEKNGAEVIDLGAVAMQGAKALWGKVRRRSSSQSSQGSITSETSSASISGSGLTSSLSIPAFSGSVSSLRTVEEDEEHYEPTSDEAGSSSNRGGLRTIPGSPPPRAGSVSSESSTSAISDTESEFDPTDLELENDTHPSYTPGNRVATAEATHSMKNKLLDIEGGASGDDGDATPRRLPSPPPRKADIEPISEEEEEGRQTPGGFRKESQWEREHHERTNKGDILGFDPVRFGRALDLARNR